jgi:transcriptional regulator GlxA family with amidase domain
VCKGAFVLAHAGLLNGKRVTTHWRFAPELRERFPKLQVVERDIFVRDGRIWTSAGITAGIDLTLALVEHDHGADLSMAIARNLVLFLRRSGHQAQFSQVLTRQANEPPRARSLAAVVLEHIDRDLSVEQLARRLGMSPRSLTRFCRSELDESPASIVRRMRLEEARRLLTETKLPLKDLARRTGIGDASTLWRIFTRELGVTPADYRQRFTRQLA